MASILARAAVIALALPTASAFAKDKWGIQPWIRPAGGASSWNDGETTTTAVSIGGNAGIDYWERGRKFPRLRGQARVGGSYITAGTNATGYEVRVGNFLGPAWKHVGLSFGPDVFYNQWTYAGTQLPATTGIATPLVVNGNIEILDGYIGAEPAWYVSGNRQKTDWQQADGVGFGHEFAWLAGLGVRIEGLHVGVHGRRQINAYGVQNSVGFSGSYTPDMTKGKKKKGSKRRR